MAHIPTKVPARCSTTGVAVTRWQVRLDARTTETAKAMAEAAECSLQGVLLGAIRHYAEAVLGEPLTGYLTPLPVPSRYVTEAPSTRPVIRIPAWWLAGVVDKVAHITLANTRSDVARRAVEALHKACTEASAHDPASFGAAIRADITPAQRGCARHSHQAAA